MIGVGVLVFIWIQLGPAQLGGRASYVITEGTSMLPTYEPDGLVVTREISRYEVGDVVAYRNGELDAVVMHRIIAIDGPTFVLKGDNNNFVDRYEPSVDDIIGEQWIYWGGVGRWLRMVREPSIFAVIMSGIALVTLRPAPANRKRMRHHA